MQFGPLQPVGLEDPRNWCKASCRRPIEDRKRPPHMLQHGWVSNETHVSGAETRLPTISGLEQAEILRYGSLHRNTFINSPQLLLTTLQCKARGTLFFAGQLVGVEGYTESAAIGGLAGINAARASKGLPLVTPPPTTAHGCRSLTLPCQTRAIFNP